jgi:type II secretory pathway pseudopilin PulG
MSYNRGKGYTILEVMIFMAVSSLMFVLGVISISGRQQQIRFTQGVREFDSVLQDVLNDVSTGYFPVSGSVSCDYTSPTVVDISVSQSSGTNDQCMLLGKAIQFSQEDDSEQTVNASYLTIYDVVGRRFTAGITPPVTYEEANPEPVPIATRKETRWGLEVTGVARLSNPSNTQLGGIVVFSALNRGGQTSTRATTEQVNIGALTTVDFNNSESSFLSTVAQITDSIETAPSVVNVDFSDTTPIVICLADESGRRKASITFGGTIAGTILDFDTYNRDICEA